MGIKGITKEEGQVCQTILVSHAFILETFWVKEKKNPRHWSDSRENWHIIKGME